MEADVAEPGDVRLRDDDVFEPWADEGRKVGVIYYARAGRAGTEAALDLELVPAATGGDELIATFRGAALADASVTVITPERWQKSFKTDGSGRVTVPDQGAGRYLVSVSHEVEEKGTVHGDPVDKVLHI